MNPIYILYVLVAIVGGAVHILRHRRKFFVNEGFVGVLYHEGKIKEILAPGRHIRWGFNYQIIQTDLRRSLLQVAGQEVLTADNIGVKLSLVLATEITDPRKLFTTVDNYSTHLYSGAQVALRSVIATQQMDSLLAGRVEIGTALLEKVAPLANEIGLKLHSIEIRDIMLPGELRKAFNDVLKAKQEGQAALERARGESASLRNLANASRLLEDHPGLATLRLFQTMENSASGGTFLMNDLSRFVPTIGKASRENST